MKQCAKPKQTVSNNKFVTLSHQTVHSMTWNISCRLQRSQMSHGVKVHRSDSQSSRRDYCSNYHTHYGLYQQQVTDIDTLITLLPVNYHSYQPRGSNRQYQRADFCLLLEMVSEMKIPNFRTALRNKEKERKTYIIIIIKWWDDLKLTALALVFLVTPATSITRSVTPSACGKKPE